MTSLPFQVTLAVEPKAYHRIRVTSGHAYNDRAYEKWRSDVAWMIRGKNEPPALHISEPVAVTVALEPRRLSLRVSPATSLRPKGLRGDIDNYAKAALDAMVESGLLADDRLVTTLGVSFLPEI
jgi:Holliday junction resolvase RusA-like endonuclease